MGAQCPPSIPARANPQPQWTLPALETLELSHSQTTPSPRLGRGGHLSSTICSLFTLNT